MMSNIAAPRIAVHIGLPKTGTTSLQRLVFARHPEIAYFGQTNIWTSGDAETILKALLVDDNRTRNEQIDDVRAVIDDALRRHRQVVISDESLSCGEFMLIASIWDITTDHSAVARKIREFLGVVDIIIVLRNQADWLISWYKQGVQNGKYVSTSFADWFDRELGDRRDRLCDLLHYDRLYSAYVDVFGAARVHVFIYERYSDDFASLAGEIARRIGVDDAAAASLARDTAINVTGAQYETAPPVLKRIAGVAPVRQLVKLVPAKLRSALRVRRQYPTTSREELAALMQIFAKGTRDLFERLAEDGHGTYYWPAAPCRAGPAGSGLTVSRGSLDALLCSYAEVRWLEPTRDARRSIW